MRGRLAYFVLFVVLFAGALVAVAVNPRLRSSRVLHPSTGRPIRVPGQDGDGMLLFSGWRITPAGRHIRTGDFPLGGALSPDGSLFAIANAGYAPNALNILDLAAEKPVAALPLERCWSGIAWSPDSKRIYVAGGVLNVVNDIYVFDRQSDGSWKRGEGFKLKAAEPQQRCIAGLALSPDGSTLYAANNSDNHLYFLSTFSGETIGRLAVGDHPGACRLSPDGSTLFVANWGGAEVAAIDVSNAARPTVRARYQTPEHPNDLLLAGNRLFVSCGNEDSVAVIDTRSGARTEVIKVSLTPRAPLGSTPNAMAMAPNGRTLYVANADNNCIAIVDVATPGRSRVRGFIPTGWYPTAVAAMPDGKRILACTGKGTGTGPNKIVGELGKESTRGFEHMGRQLFGMLSFVDVPSEEGLARFTKQVVENSPYRDSLFGRLTTSRKTAIPSRPGDPSPIKYVLYIIKENRTYDQVFGDLPKGNGDPKLVLFGREVTPNQHALAEQFVLLDNLYCSGEVSADGHPWSTAAYATDFTQRSWVMSYSGKGSTNRSNSVADPKGGYIWEACKRAGLTFRTYGEYAGHPSLEGNSSLAYVGKGEPGSAPAGRDYEKADIFIKEFREFEKAGKIPRFTIMSLGENHTHGTSPGQFTPKACVASNDLALGKIVEAITRSSVWKEFAIFVIEDDAQNGPDHVDSHRTTGLIISPYTRRGHVDSTMYTTCSMLRTMELILGLPPLTQYDASATPMFESFTDRPDLSGYTALPARIDLQAKNPAVAYGAAESAAMDWSEYDRIDEAALNRILWFSIKGKEAPMPAPVRRAILAPGGVTHGSLGKDDEENHQERTISRANDRRSGKAKWAR